jgi:hypothetical protein
MRIMISRWVLKFNMGFELWWGALCSSLYGSFSIFDRG